MVNAGCAFVVSIHSSRTCMSGSFESVWWNVCVHKPDLGLYSHLKEFWGNGVKTHVNSKGKIPSTGKIFLRGGLNLQCCIKQDSEPNTLPMSHSSLNTNSSVNQKPCHISAHLCLIGTEDVTSGIERWIQFLHRRRWVENAECWNNEPSKHPSCTAGNARTFHPTQLVMPEHFILHSWWCKNISSYTAGNARTFHPTQLVMQEHFILHSW